MRDLMTEEAAKARAEQRQAGARYGIGAAAWRNVTLAGQDGLAVRLVVTDGETYGTVDASIPSVERIESERFEHGVEDAAKQHRRLSELIAASPLNLRHLVWDVEDS